MDEQRVLPQILPDQAEAQHHDDEHDTPLLPLDKGIDADDKGQSDQQQKDRKKGRVYHLETLCHSSIPLSLDINPFIS